MRPRFARFAVLLTLFAAACRPELPVPPDAQLACVRDDDCPTGFFCNGAKRCTALSHRDSAPPVLAAAPVIAPEVGGRADVFRVSFEVIEPLLSEPEVTLALELPGGTVRRALTKESSAGAAWVYAYRPAGDEPPGPSPLSITLVDRSGNTASGLGGGAFSFDFEPPRAGDVAIEPAVASSGTAVRARFRPSEPLAAAKVTLGDFAELVRMDSSGEHASFELVPRGDEPEGEFPIRAELTDEAGNVSEPLLLGHVRLDFRPPARLADPALPDRPLRAGEVVSLELRFDEPPAADAVTVAMRADGQEPIVFDRVIASPTAFTFVHAIGPGEGGTYTVGVSGVADAAGNAADDFEVGTISIDEIAPALDGGVTVLPAVGTRTSTFTVRFRATEPLGRDPEVVLRFASTSGLRDRAFAKQSFEGGTYLYEYRAVGDEPQGQSALAISLEDLAGNAATALGGGLVSFDFDPPRASDASVGPAHVRAGTTIRARFRASEPLGTAAAVALEGVAPLGPAGPDAGHLVFEYTPTGREPEGDAPVTARLVDAAGNESGPLVLGTVRLDFTAPALTGEPVLPDRTLRPGELATVEVRFDEPPVADAIVLELRAPGGEAIPFERLQIAPTVFTFLHRIPPGEHGTFDLVLRGVRDVAGNVAAESPLGVLLVDGIAPSLGSAAVLTGGPSVGPAGRLELAFVASERVTATASLMSSGGARWPFALERQFLETQFFFSFEPTGDEPEGPMDVLVSLSDGAGNTAGPFPAGSVVFDFTPPRLLDTQPTPRIVKAGDRVVYSVTPDEPLAAAPTLAVSRRGGGGTLAFAPLGGTKYAFDHVVAGGAASGTYDVSVTMTDAAGNTAPEVAASPLELDLAPPVFSRLAVTPARIDEAGDVTATFDLDEDLPIVVTIGGRRMDCGARASGSPNYRCTRAMQGDELDAGTEASQIVLVETNDAAGNRAVASASVVFDFRDPGVAAASVAYVPSPDTPLPTVTKAKGGTTVRVQVIADELLDVDAGATLTATNGTTTLAFASAGLGQGGGLFEAVVPSDATDGSYTARVSWTDRAGNRATAELGKDVLVKTSRPVLSVDQAKVVFVRHPSGSGATEELAKNGVRAGPHSELAPEDTIAGTSVPKEAFAFVGGAAPTRLRLWGDAAMTVAGGVALPKADGSWPRQRLPGFDAPALHVTGVDEAGNESAAVKLTRAEWVAASGGARSPHRLLSSLHVGKSLAQELVSTATIGSEPGAADGAAMLARAEQAWRERRQTDTSPPLRARPVMAYDSARGRVVLFGGFATAAVSVVADTWEWDGLRWTDQAPIGPSPEPRQQAGMAYDAARGRIVLFGGATSASASLQDTWEWDGSTWTERAPAKAPPARFGHGLAYDAARGRVVLFGGRTNAGSSWRNDVWEWDGAAWIERTPDGPGPSPRSDAMLAYDFARARIVAFGGSGAAGHLQDTWEWDGTTWTEKVPAPALPSARSAALFAWDSSRRRLVLFGGRDGAGACDDLWEWTGSAWREVPVTGGTPSGRSGGAGAFDAARGRLVLFGGTLPGGTSAPGTWEWDGSRWSDRTPSAATPRARSNHALAYDAVRERVVLYGGKEQNGNRLGDTWEWDGSRWTEVVSGTKPESRYGHALAYDAARKRVVLFGGHVAGGWSTPAGPVNGTWEWDGATWVRKTPATSPAARHEHAMAYDAVRERLVLFGGLGESFPSRLDDTWEWDGSNWTAVGAGVSAPEPRSNHAMAFDAARARTVLYGGQLGWTSGWDTWSWNATTWLARGPGTVPAASYDHALAYDSTNERTVLFGGGGNAGAGEQTWEFDGAAWIERTPTLRSPPPRLSHALAYDSARRRLVLFGGMSISSARSDTWELDADPTREPAIQFAASADGAGLSRSDLSGLRVRAWCGGRFAPFGAADTGATLWGWAAGAPGRADAEWLELAAHETGFDSSSPHLPDRAAALLDWEASSATEARRFLLERDLTLAFQCRPSGSSGAAAGEAAVALDYVEVRVRYAPGG